MSSSQSETEWIPACKIADIKDGKLHTNVGGRFVTLIKRNDNIHCIDSICFHMGGPLGAGDIEDVDGSSCIICPWHYLKIDINDGKKLSHRITSFDERGKPAGFQWEKSTEVFQRVHEVRVDMGTVLVKLSTTQPEVQSDRYCTHAAAAKALGNSKTIGRDGKRIRF